MTFKKFSKFHKERYGSLLYRTLKIIFGAGGHARKAKKNKKKSSDLHVLQP